MALSITHKKVSSGTSDPQAEVDLAAWNDTHAVAGTLDLNQINGTNSIGGNLGINQASPLCQLHVGSANVTNSNNPSILISQDRTMTADGHGYSDSTNWIPAASVGYAPFDARITIKGTFSGSGTPSHVANFQAAATYGGTVTVAYDYGLYSAPTINSGASVTNRIGMYIAATGGSGSVLQEFGIYIQNLHRGTAQNYSMYAEASTGSGNYSMASISGINMGASGGDYASIGYNYLATNSTGVYNYGASNFASWLRFASGGLQTFTAVSGTGGAAITAIAGPVVVQGATAWSAPSDARLKDNVREASVLDWVERFRAVSFNWKHNGRPDFGVIAQELYAIHPELADKGNDAAELDASGEGMWTVPYDKLAPLALQGVKELKALILKQAKRIDDLEQQLASKST